TVAPIRSGSTLTAGTIDAPLRTIGGLDVSPTASAAVPVSVEGTTADAAPDGDVDDEHAAETSRRSTAPTARTTLSTRLPRYLPIEIRRLIRKRRHHDRRLAQIVDVAAIGRVLVRVVRAGVVVDVVP